MQTFESITNRYIGQLNSYTNKEKLLSEKMLQLQLKLNTLQQRKDKLHFPYWVHTLLRPIVRQIRLQLTDWVCEDKRFTPLGIGCRVTVFFIKKGLPKNADKWQEGNSIYITFLPGQLSKGELYYETGEKNNRFEYGTLGAINGFNQITKVLESVEEAIAFLKRQALTPQKQ
jgi:hypothetical protein